MEHRFIGMMPHELSAQAYAAEITSALRAIPDKEDRKNAATYLCGVAQGLLTASQIKDDVRKKSKSRKGAEDGGEVHPGRRDGHA